MLSIYWIYSLILPPPCYSMHLCQRRAVSCINTIAPEWVAPEWVASKSPLPQQSLACTGAFLGVWGGGCPGRQGGTGRGVELGCGLSLGPPFGSCSMLELPLAKQQALIWAGPSFIINKLVQSIFYCCLTEGESRLKIWPPAMIWLSRSLKSSPNISRSYQQNVGFYYKEC